MVDGAWNEMIVSPAAQERDELFGIRVLFAEFFQRFLKFRLGYPARRHSADTVYSYSARNGIEQVINVFYSDLRKHLRLIGLGVRDISHAGLLF
jgi:hypothetical protein